MNRLYLAALIIAAYTLLVPPGTHAQSPEPTPTPTPLLQAEAGPERLTAIDKRITFDAAASILPPDTEIREVVWDFGDGVRTTGEKVSHAYSRPGTYRVRLTLDTNQGITDDTTQVKVFSRVIVLLTDSRVPTEQIALYQQQAVEEKTLLYVLRAGENGTEALSEEDLTQQLASAREEIRQAHLIAAWTSGSVGINTLSRFAQHIRQADELSLSDLDLERKGIVVFSETPFAVLAPAAQSVYDQLQPSFVLLARPTTLPLLFTAKNAEEARTIIISAQPDHRLLGAFSGRLHGRVSPFNFMSYGLNYLVNHGVPINNIVLILMIPVIATILAFARQVIGIKGFGLVTPAMTTLAFLVVGLAAGLVVFLVVLLSGTLTRILMRRLHLLYLPRMALVLTTVSLAMLVMLGIGAATGQVATLAFSVFPILILTILAEEFIAVQFTRGLRTALRLTAWTLLLVIACYFIVSWQLLRTFLLSYPEIILFAIPLNITLGRFTGLRLVEYIRFRELLRYGRTVE